MRKFEKNEIKVGLFVFIPVVIVFMVLMFKLGYSFMVSTIDVYLKIDSLLSVKKGTVVMIKGYQIGKVVDIVPVYEPALHFLATMRINKNIELYENSTVMIQNQNVLGDPSIEIGNLEAKGERLKNGDVLEGVEYSGLNAILQDVHKLLGRLTETVGGVNFILGESMSNIRNLVANLSSSAANLNTIIEGSQRDIFDIMKSFRATAQTMNEISIELQKNPMKFLFK